MINKLVFLSITVMLGITAHMARLNLVETTVSQISQHQGIGDNQTRVISNFVGSFRFSRSKYHAKNVHQFVTSSPYKIYLPINFKNHLFEQAFFGVDGNLYLGTQMLLDYQKESPGCFGGGEISYSPTMEYFLVVLSCFEGDNDAFLFMNDGSGKIKITEQWDYVNYFNYYWDSDGKSFVYQRINSCCVIPPPDAPPEGWVRYIIETQQKILLTP